MAGFLTCSPLSMIIKTNNYHPNGSLPNGSIVSFQNRLTRQWQQVMPGFQNLQLRVQLRTFTGFPFTNRLTEARRLHHNSGAKVWKIFIPETFSCTIFIKKQTVRLERAFTTPINTTKHSNCFSQTGYLFSVKSLNFYILHIQNNSYFGPFQNLIGSFQNR